MDVGWPRLRGGKKIMIKIKFFLFSLLIMCATLLPQTAYASCSSGYDCSKRGVGDEGSGCSSAAWEAKLVGQESGGNYNSQAPNSSAAGRYQFIDSTRSMIGNKHNLPCSGGGQKAAFASCPGLQDDYFRALVQENKNNLQNTCNQYCGTKHNGIEVTMSGMLAMAHNQHCPVITVGS